MKTRDLLFSTLVSLSLFGAGCASRPAETHSSPMPQVAGSLISAERRLPVFPPKGATLQKEMRTQSREETKLIPDLAIDELKDLAKAWERRTETIAYESTMRNGVPARLAIRQVSGPKKETVYVCIHGLFGESLNWKYIAAILQSENEVWMVDLPGSGLSDCPDPKRVGKDGYSPEALAERVLQALESRLKGRPEVKKLILVGHSLGGMVTLRMFMNDDLRQRYDGVLSKVEGLALFAPCDVSVPHATDTWTTFMGIDGFKAGLGSALWVLQYKSVHSLQGSFYKPQLTSRELADSGIHIVCSRDHRESTKAIMSAAVPWRVFGKKIAHERVHQLEPAYAQVKIPCLIVWGNNDETLPSEMGYKIMHDLPDARLVVIPDTMHLLPLERPRVCAELVRQFHSQLGKGELAAARTVQTVDPVIFEQNLLAGRPGLTAAGARTN